MAVGDKNSLEGEQTLPECDFAMSPKQKKVFTRSFPDFTKGQKVYFSNKKVFTRYFINFAKGIVLFPKKRSPPKK